MIGYSFGIRDRENQYLNYDAHENDAHKRRKTFERNYGPSYLLLRPRPTHFIVLDDVTWVKKRR